MISMFDLLLCPKTEAPENIARKHHFNHSFLTPYHAIMYIVHRVTVETILTHGYVVQNEHDRVTYLTCAVCN